MNGKDKRPYPLQCRTAAAGVPPAKFAELHRLELDS